MLKSMRDSVKTPFIKGLLIILVLSFVSFYGFNRVRSGCGSDAAAIVNGEEIGLGEFFNNLRNSYDFYRRIGMFKDGQDEEMMERLKGMVLENLINNRLKIQEAKRLNLTVSNLELAHYIKSQFSDPKTGEFNKKNYDFYMRQIGMTSEQFEEAQRERLLSEKLDEFLRSTAKISREEVMQDYRIKNEQIDLAFVKIGKAQFSSGLAKPKDDELKAFYGENPSLFMSPEERKIEFLYANPEDFMTVSDDELKEYFNTAFIGRKDQELQNRRIRASHILFRAEDGKKDSDILKKAGEALSKIRDGARFEDFSSEFNPDATRYKGGDLGYFGRGKMAKEFEEASFSMKIGEVSKPVKTSFGYHLIKVTDIIPEGGISLERLRKEVELAYINFTKLNPEKFKPFSDRMAKALTEIREKALKDPQKSLKEYAISGRIYYGETGFFKAGESIPGLIDSSMLIRSAFGLAPNEISNVNTGFISKTAYLVKLLKINEPLVIPFDEAKDLAGKELADRKARDLAKLTAERILAAAINEPLKFTDLAAREKLNVVKTGLFKRNRTGAIPVLGTHPEIMKKGFALTKESPVMREMETHNDEFIIVKLNQRIDADMAKFEEEADNLIKIALEEKQNELLRDYMKLAHERADIKRFEIPKDYIY